MNLDTPAPALHELERRMRLNEDILRFLTIRVEELEEGPSIVLQSRGGRDDRGDRGDRGGRGRGGYGGRGPRSDGGGAGSASAATEDKPVEAKESN
jgi:small subunit ribosomal protein S6